MLYCVLLMLNYALSSDIHEKTVIIIPCRSVMFEYVKSNVLLWKLYEIVLTIYIFVFLDRPHCHYAGVELALSRKRIGTTPVPIGY